jgi:hypothetical protein
MSSHQELLDRGIRSGHEYLESFRELGENWDGEGADPVPHQAIALAHKIMDAVGEDKFVVPNNEGEVMFEWDVDGESHNFGVGQRESSGGYIVTINYFQK